MHLTHYCNQMSPLHHREIGLVGSGLLDREIKIEIICDTIHLCADMLKTVFKNKETDQMMMITVPWPAPGCRTAPETWAAYPSS